MNVLNVIKIKFDHPIFNEMAVFITMDFIINIKNL